MSRGIPRFILVLTASLFLASCSRFSARITGIRDAKRDLAKGTFAVETMGLRRSDSFERDEILRQRHGIETRVVAGCVVTEELVAHMEGYNSVMKPEIRRRFGQDVFERTLAEAGKNLPEP